MSTSDDHRHAVELSQDVAHIDGYDYTVGSPHLRHASLRNRIDDRITGAISNVLSKKPECAVLEIGAGHGSFTGTVLAAGGNVTATEMSRASFDHLAAKYRGNPAVRVLYDADGKAPFMDHEQYDVVLLISVLHHIPDYLQTVANICDNLLRPSGSLVTFQDPVWYPRQKRWERTMSSALYLIWRTLQGEFRRGLATRWRRLRGVYSDSEPSDLVEYHVVRQGVDDLALQNLLQARFASVEMDRYFSTQSPTFQSFFGKHAPPNTFGILASGRV